MNPHTPRVIVERVDYRTTLRITRLFGCFRTAIHPSRMMLALLLIVSLFIAANLLDMAAGPRVLPGEFNAYIAMNADDFKEWYVNTLELEGPAERLLLFDTAISHIIGNFDEMIRSTLSLRLGLDQFAPGANPHDTSVIAALRRALLLPAWLWYAHTWYTLIFIILFVALWSLIGGAISRQTIVEASQYRLVPFTEAIAFTYKRWPAYIIAPLIPLILIAAGALLMSLYGLLTFNLPVTNMIGGLLFFIVLLGAGIMALLLIGWVLGVHLIYPALSAEGTDALDAASRAFSYVIARPWRHIWYSLIALIYGAATYLFAALLVFLAVYLAHRTVGAGVVADGPVEGISVFESILNTPRLGYVSDLPDPAQLGWTDKVTAGLVQTWIMLFIALVAAYVISYYFSAYGVIYLLLRQNVDGIDPDELYADDPGPTPADVAEKIEPVPAAGPAEEPDAGGQ